MTSKKQIVDRFFNSKMRQSAFKYEWTASREHILDCAALKQEAANMNINAYDSTEVLAQEVCKLLKKHTSSKNYSYVLSQTCRKLDAVVEALADAVNAGQTTCAEIRKSPNFAVLNAVETGKTRRSFNSLKKMQAYADKHGFGINVYDLYEDWKKSH